MPLPFIYRLRVRYHECDGQKIVFNARYAEYIDIAALEYARHIVGSVDSNKGGIDWRLVQQELQWKAPAHFDEVLDVQVRTKSLGNTSFCLLADVVRPSDDTLLVSAETTYVVYDEARASKAPIPDGSRAALSNGAPGIMVDCSGGS
ncbi:MAG: acyl-CoA thioesterase [Myxococcales bacterium]|nr:acyl-CoA thioesterase [Myxococcales bacterium]